MNSIKSVCIYHLHGVCQPYIKELRNENQNILDRCYISFFPGLVTMISDAKLDPDTYIGIWKFDEGKGDTAKDASDNGHDGTLMSNPKWVEGKFGDALEFDGTNYIDMGQAESLQFHGNVTILFWAKPENVAAGRQNIVCKAYGGEGCLTQESSGTMSFYWGDGSGNAEPYVEVLRPLMELSSVVNGSTSLR